MEGRSYVIPKDIRNGLIDHDEDELFAEDIDSKQSKIARATKKNLALASESRYPMPTSPDSSFSQLRGSGQGLSSSFAGKAIYPDLDAADTISNEQKEKSRKLQLAQALIERFQKQQKTLKVATVSAPASSQPAMGPPDETGNVPLPSELVQPASTCLLPKQEKGISKEKMEHARRLIQLYQDKAGKKKIEEAHGNGPSKIAVIHKIPATNIVSLSPVEDNTNGVLRTAFPVRDKHELHSNMSHSQEHEIEVDGKAEHLEEDQALHNIAIDSEASVHQCEETYLEDVNESFVEDVNEAAKTEELPSKIPRNVCLSILGEALETFKTLDDIHDVHASLSDILKKHKIYDQEWFQACAESYILESENGDSDMVSAIALVMEQVQKLQEISDGRLRVSASEPSESSMKSSACGRNVDVEPEMILAGNLRKLGMIEKIISGEVVTERQRRRREERAKARVRRAQARAKKSQERLQKVMGDNEYNEGNA